MCAQAPSATDASVPRSTKILLALLGLVAGSALVFVASLTDGAPFWLLLTMGATVLCAAVRVWCAVLRPGWAGAMTNLALVVASIGLTVCAAELVVAGWVANPEAVDTTDEIMARAEPLLAPGMLSETALERVRSRAGFAALPAEWRLHAVDVPGAYIAYRWHDALHVMDINRFRRTSALPSPTAERFRIVVVGDSLTYGAGVAADDAYAALLEAHLSDTYAVETINLGVNGHQSEDILNVVREFVPQLQPDLVIYGVCLNDFLPSGVDQYQSDAFSVPLPDWLKGYFVRHSRLAALVESRYDVLLISLGLRRGFIEDLLSRGFEANRERFGADVRGMVGVLEAQGIPGIAMVLHQNPAAEGPSRQTADIAESLLEEAGFRVVGSQRYFEHFDGQALRVSAWEGHPNEIAHAVFASLLAEPVTELPALEAYRLR